MDLLILAPGVQSLSFIIHFFLEGLEYGEVSEISDQEQACSFVKIDFDTGFHRPQRLSGGKSVKVVVSRIRRNTFCPVVVDFDMVFDNF